MNDKDRLQRIKEDVSFWEYCVKNTHYCELVSHDIEKIKWLIEQAEKLQLCQESYSGLDKMYEHWRNKAKELEKQLQQAQAKAERYKEALENIEALEFFTNFNDEERFNAALYHAKRALEGES